ncbi:hypothetical protein TNCV_1581561 [Trichonephila clavipes]|nr:hypothetical protein TNCV_1581561 [Trichonephila clavipes]
MPKNYFIYFSCILYLHVLVSSKVHGHEDVGEDHDESHHDDNTSDPEEELDFEYPNSSDANPNEENDENLTTNNDSENNADNGATMEKEYDLDNFPEDESVKKIENKISDGVVMNTTSDQENISNTNNMNDTDIGGTISDNHNHQNDEANKSKSAGQTQNFNTANEGPRLDEYPTDENEASAYESFYPDGRTKATPVDTKNSANDQELNNTESLPNDLDATNENESTEKGEEHNDKSLNLMNSKFGKALSHKMNENFSYREHFKDIESVDAPPKGNTQKVKSESDPLKSNFTFILEAFDETIELILNILKPIVIWPHVVITVQNRTGEKNISFSDLDDLNIYEGALESKKISYVCGFIVNDIFSGIVMFENGTILHGEFSKNGNVLKHSHLHNESDEEMGLSHSHSCKREEEKIKCYESGKKKKRNNLSFFRTSILSDSGVLRDER